MANLTKSIGLNGISKLCNISAIFLVSVFLTQAMGAEGYGAYSYSIAVLGLIYTPIGTAVSNLLVRELSLGDNVFRQSVDYSVVEWSRRLVLVIFIASFIVLTLMQLACPWGLCSDASGVYVVGTIVMLLILVEVRICGLVQSSGAVVLAQFPAQVFRPVLFLVTLLLVFLSVGVEVFTPVVVMGIYAVACSLSLLCSVYMFKFNERLGRYSHGRVFPRNSPWLPKLAPLVIVSVLGILNTQIDFVILGFYVSDTNVGIYRAAIQFSFLLNAGLLVVNVTVAHQVSGLQSGGDLTGVQRSLNQAFVFLMVGLTPIASLLLFFPDELLSTFFGNQFSAGTPALRIHVIAQWLSAFFGPVGVILLMTGNERFVKHAVLASLLIKASLCFYLIPSAGILGAALASLIGVFASNIYMWFVSFRKVGLNTLEMLKIER